MDKQLATELAKDLEAQIGTLQFQVLNNLDEIAGSSNPNLDPMVKKPMMRAVAKLRIIKQKILDQASRNQS